MRIIGTATVILSLLIVSVYWPAALSVASLGITLYVLGGDE